MPALFAKLNLGEHRDVVVLGAPASFERELARLVHVTVRRDLRSSRAIGYAIAFCPMRADVARLAPALAAKAPGDPLLWFAYPKGTSKRYRSDYNRDAGWEPLLEAGFMPVRQVAIDEDWSALRFRRSQHISQSIRRERSNG